LVYSEGALPEGECFDGTYLKQALLAAATRLEKRITELNDLNVYPVPDGDTGINMYLTMQSVTEAVKELPATSASEVAATAARGALMGARGNSGVILSQIFRGLAHGLEKKERFNSLDLAQALRQASETAYRAMFEPTEGTILTVAREAAEAALRRARQGANLKQTMTAVVSQARRTVSHTPELLPRLKEAGVVDAGGKGLYYIFCGIKEFIHRQGETAEKTPFHAAVAAGLPEKAGGYGYDLQFIVRGAGLPRDEMHRHIAAQGESVLVVGDEKLVRVHVHTPKPQAVVDYCRALGQVEDLVLEDMDAQVRARRKPRPGARAKAPSQAG